MQSWRYDKSPKVEQANLAKWQRDEAEYEAYVTGVPPVTAQSAVGLPLKQSYAPIAGKSVTHQEMVELLRAFIRANQQLDLKLPEEF